MGIRHFPNGFARYQSDNVYETIGPSTYISCDFCQELINENILDEHMFEPNSSNYCMKARQHISKANLIFYTDYDECYYCSKYINRPNLLQHMKDCEKRAVLKSEKIICKHFESNYDTYRPNCTKCAKRRTDSESTKKYKPLQKITEICLYTFGIDNSIPLGNLLQEFVKHRALRNFTFNLYRVIRLIKRNRRLPTYTEWNGLFMNFVYHCFLNLSDIIFVEKPNIIPSLYDDPEFKALGDDWLVVKEMPSHIKKPKYMDDGLYRNIGTLHFARGKYLTFDYTSKDEIEIQYST